LIDTEKCNFDEHKELKTGSIPKARYNLGGRMKIEGYV
jgi:hypothetical protein